MSDSLRPHESQHTRPPCPSPTPGIHSDSRPSSQWCHPAISSSVVPFSSCPQSLPASESFPISQLFARGGQTTGISALASFLPKKTQGWSPYYYFHFTYLKLPGLRKCANNPSIERQSLNGGLAGSRVAFLHVYMALCLFPLEKCEHFSGKIWSVIYFCVFTAFNRAILGAQEMSLASWKVLLKHMAPRKGLSSNDTWIQGGKHTHTHTHTETQTHTHTQVHTQRTTPRSRNTVIQTHTHT